MSLQASTPRRVGVAIVGLGGAVASTAVAGVELMRLGAAGTLGLPLADLPPELVGDLPPYEQLVFGGWDVFDADLREAATTHNVLTPEQLAAASASLAAIRPWPAVNNTLFCRNIAGRHLVVAEHHRAAVELIRQDLRRFRSEHQLASVVMVNLASTERPNDSTLPTFGSVEAFEAGLERNAPEIGPAMLYAYAAIAEQVPYVNFTPSVAVDIPALKQFAEREGVPVMGKDGKTGQTMMKTVIAAALRSRALRVDGWYSTNILGNRDGLALADGNSLQSKIDTKSSVIDQILGYKVEDHIVDIRYYRPRGDNKEAWDNIDISGFLGQPMSLKINFLCRDSILAAPLVIELARLMDLAQRRRGRGVQEQLSYFFKLPMTAEEGAEPEHALHAQEQHLWAWLAQRPVERDRGSE
jgi:myo-inositol-1-phosphate synthase